MSQQQTAVDQQQHQTPELLIKDIILNTKQPLILKNFKLQWKCFQMTIKNWLSYLQEDDRYCAGVDFDCGSATHHDHPQWERDRYQLNMLPLEFYQKFNNHNLESELEHWASFSYKNLNDLPVKCRDGISYSEFGCNIDLQNISFWLGSKGAHTPCHYDTYGCNIVTQVFGRKSWLLFPPQTPFTSSRIPYEESSVYCTENLFSPSNLSQFNEIHGTAYHVILEPGDVLIVPPKWWHYVENLELSLAINTWIPLESDLDAQLDECIVKLQISQMTQNLDDHLKRQLINPNEISNIYEETMENQLNLLATLSDCIKSNTYREKIFPNNKTHGADYITEQQCQNKIKLINQKLNNQIELVENIESNKFYEIIELNSKRYRSYSLNDKAPLPPEQSIDYQRISNYLNVACNRNIIQIMKNQILKN